MTQLTKYYFRVQSTDAAGKTAQGEAATFTTGSASAAGLYYQLAGIQRQADGSYAVQVLFGNNGGVSIPDVEISAAGLGASSAPTSPTLPINFNLLSASMHTVTLTFSSSTGTPGLKANLVLSGETQDAFGNPTGFFKITFKNILLP